MNDLLPCPFCGSKDVYLNNVEDAYYQGYCGDCASRCRLINDKSQAINNWNTRSNPESYEFRLGYMSAYARMMGILNIELWDNADLLNREVKTQSVKKEDIWKIPTLADYVCDKCNEEHYKCECEE